MAENIEKLYDTIGIFEGEYENDASIEYENGYTKYE